jgi:hypothetical protein
LLDITVSGVQHSWLILTTSREGTKLEPANGGKVEDVRLRGRVPVGDPVIDHQLCRDGVGSAIIPEWEVHYDYLPYGSLVSPLK